MILDNRINLKNCWHKIETDLFRKIRGGFQEERSPLMRDPRYYTNSKMIISTIKIMQHNVLNWNTNKVSLIDYYIRCSPDIIAIHSHGQKTSVTQNTRV